MEIEQFGGGDQTDNNRKPIDDDDADVSNAKPVVEPLSKRKYAALIIAALIFVSLLVLTTFGIYRGVVNLSGGQGGFGLNIFNEGGLEPQEGEKIYENSVYNFAIIIREDWQVEDYDDQIVINTGQEGEIQIQVFTDDTYRNLEVIDQTFCQEFEEGFLQGVDDIDNLDDFDFSVTDMNGTSVCVAEGFIFPEVRQKYLLLFNREEGRLYTVVYTALGGDNDAELIDRLDRSVNSIQLQ